MIEIDGGGGEGVRAIGTSLDIDLTRCRHNRLDAAYQISHDSTQAVAAVEFFLCYAWLSHRKNGRKACTAGLTSYAVRSGKS